MPIHLHIGYVFVLQWLVSVVVMEYMAWKAWNIYYLSVYIKMFANPCSLNQSMFFEFS